MGHLRRYDVDAIVSAILTVERYLESFLLPARSLPMTQLLRKIVEQDVCPGGASFLK